MYSELLSHIITTQDAALLKREIGLLQDSTYKTKKNAFTETLKNQVRQWVAEAIETDLQAEAATPEKYLAGLLEELTKNTSIQMNIAFEPTRQNIENIHQWLFSQLAVPVLLDMVYDPQVVAGIKFSYNGKYFDFSLEKKLEPAIESIAQKTLKNYA